MSGEVVYVLGAPGSNTVKIGRTTNLAKRVADIQRMSPVALAVLWTHPGGHELETHLHRHFADFRSHGEWFAFRVNAVGLIQWAVESEAWARPKVRLRKARTKARRVKVLPRPRTPIAEALRSKVDTRSSRAAGTDADLALALVAEAGADHRAKRAELETVIAEARRAGLSLTLISEHTPFSREWIRRIADRVDRERAS